MSSDAGARIVGRWILDTVLWDGSCYVFGIGAGAVVSAQGIDVVVKESQEMNGARGETFRQRYMAIRQFTFVGLGLLQLCWRGIGVLLKTLRGPVDQRGRIACQNCMNIRHFTLK